jgi:undecaprenyl-diphosphatase
VNVRTPARSGSTGWRDWIGRIETKLLLTTIGVALAIAGFAGLAGEAREGDVGAVDRILLTAVRSPVDPNVLRGPRWVMEAVRDVTALGGFTVLTLVSVTAVTLLLIRRRWAQAAVFSGAVIFAQVLAEVTKRIVDRPRPAVVAHLDLVYSSSFPSGHALMSPVVYLTLAAILCVTSEPRRERAVLIGLAIALSAAIGVSRVFLGVHWPTDVLAGWILGALIALGASYVVRRVGGAAYRRHSLDPAAGT